MVNGKTEQNHADWDNFLPPLFFDIPQCCKIEIVFFSFFFFFFNFYSKQKRFERKTKKSLETRDLETDGPDTDERVRVTGEEGLTISRPSQGDGLGRVRLLSNVGELGLELIDNRLGLQIPDLDAGGSGSAQPVTVGGEDQSVDDIITLALQGVQVLALVQVPEHGDTITSTRGAERTIGRNGDSVDVTRVSDVVGAQLALGKLPDLSREQKKITFS